jgi:hypothetical protein
MKSILVDVTGDQGELFGRFEITSHDLEPMKRSTSPTRPASEP